MVQIKVPVSRRNRQSGNQLSGILRKAKKQIYVYVHTYAQVCMFVCMIV